LHIALLTIRTQSKSTFRDPGPLTYLALFTYYFLESNFFCCTSHFLLHSDTVQKYFSGSGKIDISSSFSRVVFPRAEKGPSLHIDFRDKTRRQLQQCNVSIPLYKMVYTPSSTPTNSSPPSHKFPKLSTSSHPNYIPSF
jgi:hypothetical protein